MGVKRKTWPEPVRITSSPIHPKQTHIRQRAIEPRSIQPILRYAPQGDLHSKGLPHSRLRDLKGLNTDDCISPTSGVTHRNGMGKRIGAGWAVVVVRLRGWIVLGRPATGSKVRLCVSKMDCNCGINSWVGSSTWEFCSCPPLFTGPAASDRRPPLYLVAGSIECLDNGQYDHPQPVERVAP